MRLRGFYNAPVYPTVEGGGAPSGKILRSAGSSTINGLLSGGAAYTSGGFYQIGTVGSAYTIDLQNGFTQECTLSGNQTCVFTLPSMPAGTSFKLVVKQPAVGAVPTVNGGVGNQATNEYRVGFATFPGVRWRGSTPAVTAAFRVADIFTFTSDGTDVWGTASQGHVYAAPFGYSAPLGPRGRKGSSQATYALDGAEFWTPLDIAKAYQIPDGDGTGVTVGCIQFQGQPNVPVLQAYMNYLGISDTPNIQITTLTGGSTALTDNGEAMLDMCVLVALLPKATHKVYMAPNSAQGMLDATALALSECDVVTSSWSFNELMTYSDSALQLPLSTMTAMEDILRTGRKRGASFFTSSGDWGSDNWQYYDPKGIMPWRAQPLNLGFPSACPSAVSVGCTLLHMDSSGIRTSEEAVKYAPIYAGGGISTVFPDTKVPFCSAFGEFMQGFAVVVNDGSWSMMSSTSGSTPFMAAVHARMIQTKGTRFDFMDFALSNQSAFFDITTGTNGAYNSGTGRDLVTGIGTPNGPAMWSALSGWSP